MHRTTPPTSAIPLSRTPVEIEPHKPAAVGCSQPRHSRVARLFLLNNDKYGGIGADLCARSDRTQRQMSLADTACRGRNQQSECHGSGMSHRPTADAAPSRQVSRVELA